MANDGGPAAMRALFKFSSPLVVVAFVMAMYAPTMAKTPRGLATISGTVRDNKGALLAPRHRYRIQRRPLHFRPGQPFSGNCLSLQSRAGQLTTNPGQSTRRQR